MKNRKLSKKNATGALEITTSLTKCKVKTILKSKKVSVLAKIAFIRLGQGQEM
jgi:hypothetical protein